MAGALQGKSRRPCSVHVFVHVGPERQLVVGRNMPNAMRHVNNRVISRFASRRSLFRCFLFCFGVGLIVCASCELVKVVFK